MSPLSASATNVRPPLLIAIAGGSGAGKTWLAGKLRSALGSNATHISLDDFYLDRSHLSASRRARINFDHPRAIDWPAVEKALHHFRTGRAASLPCYDFKTHCRRPKEKIVRPGRVVIMDGLWLLRRPSLRRLFDWRIFVDCPTRTRWQRRIARDLRARGRTRALVQRQLRDTVEPMHARFVAPQKRQADLVLPHNLGNREAQALAKELRLRLGSSRPQKQRGNGVLE